MTHPDPGYAPASDQLGLPDVIQGLIGDLEALRAGEISVNDALARAAVAKQIFNGVRLYLNGSKLLAEGARNVSSKGLRDERQP